MVSLHSPRKFTAAAMTPEPRPSADDLRKASTLVEALPYIKRFAGQRFVISCDRTFDDEAHALSLANDLVLLRYVGIDPLIVAAEDTHLVSAIARRGGKAVGLSGQDGKILSQDSVDPSLLKIVLERGYIPVIKAVVPSREGSARALDPTEAASAIAAALKAAKLIVLEAGLSLSDGGKALEFVDLSLAEEISREMGATAAVGKTLRHAIQAIKSGVTNVHLIDSVITHALLLEIFTDRGIGVMITNERCII